MLPIAILIVLVVAPLSFAVAGLARLRATRGPHERPPAWRWRATAASMLLYTLAFNLTFFAQELFLVLPKAFTPGLRPTLFHNNHDWQGTNPLASLFQGTGVVATVLLGLVAFVQLRRSGRAPGWWRLLLFWIAFSGVFMALPQFVTAALLPNGDVARAMGYFGLAESTKTAIALLALIAIPLFAVSLLRPLLALAEHRIEIAGATARMRFVFLTATLPALCAIAAIVPFRIPREWIEVVLVPAAVTVAGLIWLQAAAWSVQDVEPRGSRDDWPVGVLSLAAAALLALFQLVLRPGIAFYR